MTNIIHKQYASEIQQKNLKPTRQLKLKQQSAAATIKINGDISSVSHK